VFNSEQFCNYIIKPSLEKVNLYSAGAETLLLGTACAESRLGTYLHQVNGPALGVFQMEPATHKDIWENYLNYRSELKSVVSGLVPRRGWGGNNIPNDSLLITDLEYACVMARLVYRRSPIALPEACEWRTASFVWKDVYNTHLGAGTVGHFMESLRDCSVIT